MQHGKDHDNRLSHIGKDRHNNTPPDDEVILRGGHPHTPEDIENAPRPARPAGEPSTREAEPARPHRPDTDTRHNEPVE